MTNFEKIKKMSVDELARFLTFLDSEYDEYVILGLWDSFENVEQALKRAKEWLESETDNEKV